MMIEEEGEDRRKDEEKPFVLSCLVFLLSPLQLDTPVAINPAAAAGNQGSKQAIGKFEAALSWEFYKEWYCIRERRSDTEGIQ